MNSDDVKVLVVDDSGIMRLIISDIIEKVDGLTVIGKAENGKEAVEQARKLNPDVILLDMVMGEYDGLYAVKRILRRQQIPIIILSAMGNSNLDPIMEALKLGAFDYINKPQKNQAKVREIEDKIIRKVKLASKANRSTIKKVETKQNVNAHTFRGNLNYDVIVIGASTGGPTALESIITKLPENLPIPVVIAQHMPSHFVPSFVERLNKVTPLEVVIARKDNKIEAGTITMAPGSRNVIIKVDEVGRVVIDYTHKQFREYNNPSINALMLSVAEVYGKRAIGVILTGMGKDGADGLEAIFKEGGFTIAQDEATSAVYGMPRAVTERGVAQYSLPLKEIPGFIVSSLS